MKISKSDLPGSSLLKNFVHDYADGYSVKLNVKDLTIEQVCRVFFVSGKFRVWGWPAPTVCVWAAD